MVEGYMQTGTERAQREYERWHDSLQTPTAPPPRLDLSDTRRSVAAPIWETALAALRVCVEQVRGQVADDLTPLRALELDNDVIVAQMMQSMAAGF